LIRNAQNALIDHAEQGRIVVLGFSKPLEVVQGIRQVEAQLSVRRVGTQGILEQGHAFCIAAKAPQQLA
jgi:uncharacterized SAM-binding protein YcdF (DUF218 family)